jgi:hypothetical protein
MGWNILLTKTVIEHEGLIHPPDSEFIHRNGRPHWIEVRLSTRVDLDRVARLIKLAVDHVRMALGTYLRLALSQHA